MMPETIFMEPADVPSVIRNACAARYNGRKYRIHAAENVRLSKNYWSGGTCSTYWGLDLATGQTFNPECAEYGNPFTHPDVPTVVLEPGKAVIEHSIFCGKDTGITVWVHPDNLRKLLPDQRAEQLSDEQRAALDLVASLKGGEYRRDEWHRRGLSGNYGPQHPAIMALVAMGLLSANRAGAIAVTIKGRNIRQQLGRVTQC